MRRRISAQDILDFWVKSGTIKCASLLVLHHGMVAIRHRVGMARFTGEQREVSAETVFTIASITKTLTATCFMQYVEAGDFSLHEPVARVLPEFGQNGKEAVTFFHLLTHTSGLPEQVEGKDELRAREGQLDEFHARICRAPLLFAPGTGYQYSNCGFGLLARAVEQVEGRRFGAVLAERIFQPLGMKDSVLGAEPRWDERIAEIELPLGQETERAFVNSRYWRGMGAPWGAMVSNTEDLALFAEAIRQGGQGRQARILAPATVATMLQDQLATLPALAERRDRRRQGLAWILQGGPRPSPYGDLTSPRTFGHGGATGTLLWVDPEQEITFVFLGNKEGSLPPEMFARLSNAVVAQVSG